MTLFNRKIYVTKYCKAIQNRFIKCSYQASSERCFQMQTQYIPAPLQGSQKS